jgi:hypothetical protein
MATITTLHGNKALSQFHAVVPVNDHEQPSATRRHHPGRWPLGGDDSVLSLRIFPARARADTEAGLRHQPPVAKKRHCAAEVLLVGLSAGLLGKRCCWEPQVRRFCAGLHSYPAGRFVPPGRDMDNKGGRVAEASSPQYGSVLESPARSVGIASKQRPLISLTCRQ